MNPNAQPNPTVPPQSPQPLPPQPNPPFTGAPPATGQPAPTMPPQPAQQPQPSQPMAPPVAPAPAVAPQPAAAPATPAPAAQPVTSVPPQSEAGQQPSPDGGVGAQPSANSFDPSKSPSEQVGQAGDPGADPQKHDAKKVTKLPIKGMSGPLPAIALGTIILIFLIVVALYAFTM